jgi:acyl-CoA synthetase (AMP-forming)/AMP-acid ligase II
MALDRRAHVWLAAAFALAEKRLRGVARAHRDLGQDRHEAIAGEAFGRQHVTFSDRLSAHLMTELQDFVKMNIAPYKYPRWIEFIAALPKTATGKIQRFKLRELERLAASALR